MIRRTFTMIVSLALVAGCGESSDDPPAMETDGDGSGATAQGTSDAAESSGAADTAAPTTADPTSGGGDSEDVDVDSGSQTEGGSDSTGPAADTGGRGVSFHPEFVWFADFVRDKCVACHNAGQNGNLVLPSVDMTNDEVRLAFDGQVATTGNLFIEPFDAPASQVYVMITNDAGEQFPPETIDRVVAWIDLGAPYYEK